MEGSSSSKSKRTRLVMTATSLGLVPTVCRPDDLDRCGAPLLLPQDLQRSNCHGLSRPLLPPPALALRNVLRLYLVSDLQKGLRQAPLESMSLFVCPIRTRHVNH